MASQHSSAKGPRRLSVVSAAVRAAVVIAMTTGWLLSVAPAAVSAADGLDGDVYTSDTYGWSVPFDDRVWTAEEVDERTSQGITLSNDSGEVFVNLVVYNDGITDAHGCLDDLDRAFTTSSDWEDVKVSRSLDAPETAEDAIADVYTGTLILDTGSLDVVLYLECREVQAATLSIAMTAIDTAYNDVLPDLSTLLTSVDTGSGPHTGSDNGPSPTGPVNRAGKDTPTPRAGTLEADTPTPGADLTPKSEPPVLGHESADRVGNRVDGTLDDSSYRSDVGYGLDWDPDVYKGDTTDDPGTGVLLENAESGATFEVTAFEDPSIEDCIAAEIQRIVESPDFISAALSNGVRPPTSSDDAVGRMLRATEDTTQQQRKIVYVECRPLLDEGDGGDPVFLVVRAISDDEDFRTSRTEFEVILASITIGAEPAAEPTAKPTKEPTKKATKEPTRKPDIEPTPKPRRTPTAKPDVSADLGETDIAGGVFVGVRVPFKVEWDTTVWDVEEVDVQGIEGISITTDQGSFGRIVSANTAADVDEEACLSSLTDGWEKLTPDLSQFEPDPGNAYAFPDGATSAYGAGTFTFDDGSTAVMIHAGACLALDAGGVLVIEIQTFEPVFGQNLAAFNEVLATLEIADGGGGQVGRSTAPSVRSLSPTTARPTPASAERMSSLATMTTIPSSTLRKPAS